jgi:hypothetical protein
MEMEFDSNNSMLQVATAKVCNCQGDCTCGNKYKSVRPVYYEVDVNQYINSLNDWD